jgi:hypothetical protein
MLIRAIVVGADIAATVYAEKILVKGHAHHMAAHAAQVYHEQLIVVGVVFMLPALLVLLVSWMASSKAAQPAPARPGYSGSFGQRTGRR